MGAKALFSSGCPLTDSASQCWELPLLPIPPMPLCRDPPWVEDAPDMDKDCCSRGNLDQVWEREGEGEFDCVCMCGCVTVWCVSECSV